MKIESIHVKNYKVFRDITVTNIPNMAVFLGMNGAGKTTFFDMFGFLNDSLQSNVRTAFAKRGGFKEVVSREQTGDIEFVIKFRAAENEPLITYELSLCLNDKAQPVIKWECMRFRRGQTGSPWKVLEFSYGEGMAVMGEINTYDDVKLAGRTKQKLDAPDILAIKGLGQFREFVAVASLRRLIEDWFVSDFRIDEARAAREAGYSERLTPAGDNLALVAKYMFDSHRDSFDRILRLMKEKVPGVSRVEAEETTDGRIVLRFQDGSFKDPFSARFVSDGTIKMFTYLLLLHDPEQHALLCIEEPENYLYPELLADLAEEFRLYSVSGGQVFISTHSPDFLNAVALDELYCLVKKDGFTQIYKASENSLIRSLIDCGDQLGSLWRQGVLLSAVSKA